MSYHEALAALVGKAIALQAEGDLTFSDLIEEPINTDALAELWLLFDEFKTATNRVERVLNDELARRMVAEDSRFSIGDWQVFPGWRSTSEKCVDHDMFYDWLDDNPAQVRKLVNPNSVRKGSLPPDVRKRLFKKERPPKAEKMAVAAPAQVLEDAKQQRILQEQS